MSEEIKDTVKDEMPKNADVVFARERDTEGGNQDPVFAQKSGLVHLHNHSEYSSLDGGSKVDDMVAKLESLGMKAMALTDHGNMQGIPSFYETLRKAGMKPILGIEIYLTNDRFDKSRGTPTWHLTLLAETTEGYHNLCKLSSWAFMDGTIFTFGRPRPRADWELLERYSKGVIAFTGCMASPIMGAIFKGELSKARTYTDRLISIFGKGNVYGEIQNVGIVKGIPADSEIAKMLSKELVSEEEAKGYDEAEAGDVLLSQTEANRILVDEICKPLGLPYLVTGDTHYLNEEDADPHDVMICIGTGQQKKGRRRFSLLPRKYYMRSEEEVTKLVAEWPEAIEETRRCAARCNAEIEWNKKLLPAYPIPDGFENSREYLRHLCFEGLEERYEEGTERYQEAVERLEMELGVIDTMGFNDYFLITWDIFNEANRRNIPTGPGRGSAAGSIVAYTLDITKLCPLEYSLLFERFLNPDRISMPDIDMDMAESYNGGRKALIEYVREKYNTLANTETAVAQIITFQRYKGRNAIKDAARALAESDAQGEDIKKKEALRLGDRLAALIPNDPKATIHSVWDDPQEGAGLRAAHARGGLEGEVVEQARWLQDMIKAYGLHAAAVIIASHDMTDELPLQRFKRDDPLHTQYDMHFCEKLGLLKMDFLGLKNLDIIWDACEKIKATRGITIRPWRDIPIDDAATYEMFARGDSIGTFQFESGGMRSALQDIRPTEFRDLVAIVALYRPGAMVHIGTYAARKHGRQAVTYPDPRVENILKETFGLCTYQEQSMLIARAVAGFSQADADDLRKAIGKKLHDKMAALKPKYIKGVIDNGGTKDLAELLWADNERSADYSFNKSHAACYAFISYITGWLKTNYPHEYMAALLSSTMGKKKEKARIPLTEAKRMGLNVLPPDLNRSIDDFAVVERKDEPGKYDILFALNAIKGVGEGVVREIRKEREAGGSFVSLFDLIRRMPSLNKSTLQALVKGGALDFTGESRKAMFDIIEESQARIKKERETEAKTLVSAVKARVEAMPEAEESSQGEQTAFLDEAFAEAVSAPKKNGKNKLTAEERRGIDGACRTVWAASYRVEEDAILQGIEEALRKEALRLARKAARNSHQEQAEAEVVGIDREESGDASLKERIEEAAQASLASQTSVLHSQALEMRERFLPHIKAEVAERKEASDLEAALDAETDPQLSKEDWERLERLNIERQMLGLYVTGHPLDEDTEQWRAYVNEGTSRGRELVNITADDIGKVIVCVGAIVGKTAIRTRSGDFMYRVVIEDLSDAKEVTFFPRTLEGGLEALLEEGQVICVEAAVEEDTFQQNRSDGDGEEGDVGVEADEGEVPIKLIASRLYKWDASKITPEFVARAKALRDKRVKEGADAAQKARADGEEVQSVRVRVSRAQFNPEWIALLEAICVRHKGEHPVKILLNGKTYRTRFRVTPSEELSGEIGALIRSSDLGHKVTTSSNTV